MTASRHPVFLRTLIAALVVLGPFGCNCQSEKARSSTAVPSGPGAPGGKLSLVELQQDDGQWVMAAKDYANTRFSRLEEINAANVKDLRVAFTWSSGMVRGHEAAPLVVAGTMYVTTPFPNHVVALDLTKPGAPVKWRYDPKPNPASQGVACCDVVNRGAAYADGKIFFNTLDNHTIALDAETGAEVWKVKLGEINRGESMTMAPLVVKDKVLVGNSGGEFGVRGWLTALDTKTGELAWRAYSTGPDADVLIGPRFKPFYEMDRGKDLGVTTWPPDKWRMGGGTVWGWLQYDPELDLVYYGTANPGPWNHAQRPGDNKWTAGMFARDPDTGEAIWFYQFSPHDLFDHDAVNESILLDLEVGGKQRSVLLRAERNGYVYVMDRATGEVLSADPFMRVNSSRGVDLKTGRLIPVKEKTPVVGKVVRDICPTSSGAKDWQPASFSPETGLLYIPHQVMCMDLEHVEANYIAGTPFVGASSKQYGDPQFGGNSGALTAWDPIARKPKWELPERWPVWSGTVVTSGEVVFYGTLDGWFKAVHAVTGEPLWQFKTGSGIVGQPITYRGPDGKQYVAIFSGIGGWTGVVVAANLDTRDPTGALGMNAGMAGLSEVTQAGGTLYVFSLP